MPIPDSDSGWLTADIGESRFFDSRDQDEYADGQWSSPWNARLDDTSYASSYLYETGAYADAEVRLQYLDYDNYGYAVGLPARSNNKSTGGTWPDSFGSVTYGGPTDTWGYADLESVVELPEFGVILRPGPESGESWGTEHAYLSIRDYDVSIPVNKVVTGIEVRITRRKSYYYDGYSSPSNYGYVDAVEMRVHFGQRAATTFEEVSTAGVVVGGEAVVSVGSTGPSTLHTGWLTADVGESKFFDSRDSSPPSEGSWSSPSSARIDDTGYASSYLYESGAFADAEVRLQYLDYDNYGYAVGLPSRSDNRGDVGAAWPDAFGGVVYGGPTDTWGYADLDSVIELPEFGVILLPGPESGQSWSYDHAYLSIRDFDVVIPAGKSVGGVEVRITRRKSYYYDGYSSPSNYGYVDAVELRVHWAVPHDTFDETSTAGVVVGGEALVELIGAGPKTYSEISTAGLRGGGSAFVEASNDDALVTPWLIPGSAGQYNDHYVASPTWVNGINARAADGTEASLAWPNPTIGDNVVSLGFATDATGDYYRWENKADVGVSWPSTSAAKIYGGPLDDWGTPSFADLVMGDGAIGLLVRAGNSTAQFLIGKNYDLSSLPDDAEVTGIEARITRRAIAASPGVSARVDGLEIRVHYTVPQTYVENSTASALVGGSADEGLVASAPTSPSAVLGGSAVLAVTYSQETTAGAALGGVSDVEAGLVSTAGVRAGSGPAAPAVETDWDTHGEWIGVYGTLGYAHPAYRAQTGTHTLPDAVSGVLAESGAFASSAPVYIWNNSTSKVGAVRDPDGSPTWARAWYHASQQDLDVDPGGPAIVSVYCWDYDPKGRRQTLELLLPDGQGGYEVTPAETVALTTSYAQGVWVRFAVPGACRVRVTTDVGVNSVVSFVAVDPAPAGSGADVQVVINSVDATGPGVRFGGATDGAPLVDFVTVRAQVLVGGAAVDEYVQAPLLVTGLVRIYLPHRSGVRLALAAGDGEGGAVATYPTRVRVRLPHSSYVRVRLPHLGDESTEV